MTDYSWAGPGRQPDGFVDLYSSAKVAIAEEHWVVHEGLAFTANHKFTSVANSSSVDLLLINPAGNYPHIHVYDIACGRGDVDVLVYEDPTASANGTEITPGNPNRNSSNTPTLTMFHTPTITDVGTLLSQVWLPPTATGVGQQAGIFLSPAGTEWILAPSKSYLIRVTNNSGATISIWERIMFYELNGFG